MKDLLEKGIKLDQQDELKSFRDLFEIGPGLIYLDGNSLGRMPHKTKDTINSLLDEEWANLVKKYFSTIQIKISVRP